MQELGTGSSLKQKKYGSDSGAEEHLLRITTTEANDIFDDDEIWNNSMCFEEHQAKSTGGTNAAASASQIRLNPEEEYFRLVSQLDVLIILSLFNFKIGLYFNG